MLYFPNNKEIQEQQEAYLKICGEKSYIHLFLSGQKLNKINNIKTFNDYLIFEEKIINEAKITDTDDLLLEDIFNHLSRKINIFQYTYKDILNLSTSSTWRYYDYFKNNCSKKLVLSVFSSSVEQVEQLKIDYPNLIEFFNNCNNSCIGLTWPANFENVLLWLNTDILLNTKYPLKRIQHEMIHVWSGFLNIDEHKSFGKHNIEKSINILNNNQQKFIELNKDLINSKEDKNISKNYFLSQYNYIIGSNGLEFEAQVNDICDAFEDVYTSLNIQEDKNIWINNIINIINENIFKLNIDEILNKLNLSRNLIMNIDYPTLVYIINYFILIGLLENKDKIYYLNECLKTHFTEYI